MKLFTRNLILIPMLVVSLFSELKAQIAYSPLVDSLSSLPTEETILLLTRQLSGDTTVMVNDQITTIASRHYLSTGNQLAAQFIYQKFVEFGYSPEYQYFNNNRGINVIASRLGTTHPDQEYIICGHYDNMPSGPLAPGADDNASGTVAVLEAARVLANISPEYTIRFAAWDEEEIGLIGSAYYAAIAAMNNDNILGVINLDMIAWDSDNDLVYSLATNEISTAFTKDFVSSTSMYEPALSHNYISITASDHASFWDEGYPAILAIEDMNDFNQYYHTPQDDINILNMPLYRALIKASIANLATNALGYRIYFEHDPITYGNSIEPIETSVTITSDNVIASGLNAPRLYYSTDGLNYDFVLPTSTVGNTYNFTMPGFTFGTEVKYYFAAQDIDGNMIGTWPSGGRGINPPGTIQSSEVYVYQVDTFILLENCSLTTPVAIQDNSNTYNTIIVLQDGLLYDLDVNIDITHPTDSELRIYLYSPIGTAVGLSDRNGNTGDNYTGTTFDDEALISIKEGEPPFTGSFRPEDPLSILDDKPITGEWKLRIVEAGNPNGGTLNNWCLHIMYRDTTVNTTDITANQYNGLEQNYPNPAVNSTNISFTMPHQGTVAVKLFDSRGKLIRTIARGTYQAGKHLIIASVEDLNSGIYYYQLESDSFSQTKRMVIVK